MCRCLALPVVLAFFVAGCLEWDKVFQRKWLPVKIRGHTIWYKPEKTWALSYVRTADIDIFTGRRLVPLEELREDRETLKRRPLWKKIATFFF